MSRPCLAKQAFALLSYDAGVLVQVMQENGDALDALAGGADMEKRCLFQSGPGDRAAFIFGVAGRGCPGGLPGRATAAASARRGP